MEGTMKQAWLNNVGEGNWEIREVPIPTPGPGQALIKIHAGSICKQTDSNTVRGYHPPHDHQCWGMLPHHMRMLYHNTPESPDPLADIYPKKYLQYDWEPFPSRMGHEMAGEIVEIGGYLGQHPYGEYTTDDGSKRVTENNLISDNNPFEVGDRVTGSPIFGGFAEYVVADFSAIFKIPEGISYETATLAEPVMCVYPHVSQTVQFRDRVVVLGVGALGFASMCIAKGMGAKQIVAVDLDDAKLEFAKAHGADVVINPKTVDNVADAIWEATDGEGADSVLEVTGEPECIQLLPYITKFGGRIGQIGACCKLVPVDWSYFHFRGLSINKCVVGSGMINAHNAPNSNHGFDIALDLIESGIVPMGEFIDYTLDLTLENLEKAFDRALHDNTMRKAMFIFK